MTNGNGQTLAIRFQGRANGGGVFWKQVMAAAFVVSIPIAFMLLQRYMITGLCQWRDQAAARTGPPRSDS
jgi:ABC-type glycerol-3-phosphate transport system permease component